MFVLFLFKTLLYVGAGHVVVTASDYVGCKTKAYSKPYCVAAFVKYKIKKKDLKKVKSKIFKKKKKCNLLKKLVGKCSK